MIEARAMSDVQRALVQETIDESSNSGDTFSLSNQLTFTQTEGDVPLIAQRSRNATFDAATMRNSMSSAMTQMGAGDLSSSGLDVCEDSAQSAPPNFTFDLIEQTEPSNSRDAPDLECFHS